jgi:hypothetical protein
MNTTSMNPALKLACSMALAATACLANAQTASPPGPTADSPLLRSVAELAQANGLALACAHTDAQRRAKALMLQHAPATEQVREVFEAATQRSFLSTSRGEQACPTAAALNVQVESLGLRLQAAAGAKAP